MVFTKDELAFLTIFMVGTDMKTVVNDKIQIKASVENQSVRFAQMSDNVYFIHEQKKKVDKDFTIVIYTSDIFSLVQNEDNVTINEKGIYFSNGGEYILEQFDFNYDDIDYLYEKMLTNKPNSDIKLVELDKIVSVYKFIGVDESLATLSIQNGYFVSSNRFDITALVNTKNDKNIFNFLSTNTATLFQTHKIDEIDIQYFENENFYHFCIGNTHIINNILEYQIPNIFEPELYNSLMHKNIVNINKDDFKVALNRIKIIAVKTLENRINLIFGDGILIIENNITGYSKEIITAEVPKCLYDKKIILSATYMNDIVNKLSGDNIQILVKETDGETITITDELDDKKFIHCLYEDIG